MPIMSTSMPVKFPNVRTCCPQIRKFKVNVHTRRQPENHLKWSPVRPTSGDLENAARAETSLDVANITVIMLIEASAFCGKM